MPKISIIIPLYNKEKQIRHTLDSILNQDFLDYEIVIVNDGSTDHSVEIVNQYYDERIRVVNQSNSGVSIARNRGIAEAKGEFVLLLDADDCLLPKAFNVLDVDGIENIDIIVASFVQTDGDFQIKRQSINKIQGKVNNPYKSYCLKDINLRIGSFFVRKTYLKTIGGFRKDLTLYEDEEWILRLFDGSTFFSSTQVIMQYVRVETGLSFGFKPIEKDWASIASVKKEKNKYKKRIIGDFVFRRFYVCLKRKDWHGLGVIWHNNSWRMLYCLFSFLNRSTKGGFIKNRLNNHYNYQ